MKRPALLVVLAALSVPGLAAERACVPDGGMLMYFENESKSRSSPNRRRAFFAEQARRARACAPLMTDAERYDWEANGRRPATVSDRRTAAAARVEQPPRGAINPRTGAYYPPVGDGVVNPRNGKFYPEAGPGYIDPRTGAFMPKQ